MEKLQILLDELIRILNISERLSYEVLTVVKANDGRVHLQISISNGVMTGIFTIELSIDLRGNSVTGINLGDTGVDSEDPLVVALLDDLVDAKVLLDDFIARGNAPEA